MESYGSWKSNLNEVLDKALGKFDAQIRRYLSRVYTLPDSTIAGSLPATLIAEGKNLLEALNTSRSGLGWITDDVNPQLNTVRDMVDDFATKLGDYDLFGKDEDDEDGEDKDDEDDAPPPDVQYFHMELGIFIAGWQNRTGKYWTDERSSLPLVRCGAPKPKPLVWPGASTSFPREAVRHEHVPDFGTDFTDDDEDMPEAD